MLWTLESIVSQPNLAEAGIGAELGKERRGVQYYSGLPAGRAGGLEKSTIRLSQPS